jgi:MFS family permease
MGELRQGVSVTQSEQAFSASKADRPGAFFYGWIVVFAAFVAFGMVYGTVTYSFTVFVNPVAKTFGATPAQVQLAFALTNVGTGILGIFAGRLLGRHSKRNCIIAGLAILAGGFYLLSVSTALWQFIALYALIVAFGAALAAPLGASAVVSNWFVQNRGRALTFATLGTSFGQLVIPKVAALIMEGHGWQAAYQGFAAALVVIAIPVIFLLVKDHPEDKGLQPYGAGPAAGAATAIAAPSLLSTRQVLGRGDFWSIGISYILCVFVYLALTASMVPYARTFGVTALQASNLVVAMGVGAIIGKLCFATWTDRIGLRNTFWVAVGLNAAALVLLLVVPDYNILFAASVCVGGAAGGILPVWPGLVGFRFGRHALPQVMGLMGPIVVSLQGFGAPLAAALHYRLAFEIFLAMLVISAFVSRNLNKPAAA